MKTQPMTAKPGKVKVMFGIRYAFGALVVGATLAGCGSGNSNNNGGGGGGNDNASQSITSSGGTVKTPSGKAAINIPNGALAATTTITITPSSLGTANGQAVSGTQYTFGPNGTQFTSPATITQQYNPNNIPTGATANTLALFMATPEDSANPTDWQPVPGSTVNAANNSVSANVSSLSTFAVMATNPFSTGTSHLTGTWSTTGQPLAAGAVLMTISPSGKVTVTNGPTDIIQYSGTGTISLSGVANIAAQGTGTASAGVSFQFQGTLTAGTSGTTGSGTWTGSNALGTASGVWSVG